MPIDLLGQKCSSTLLGGKKRAASLSGAQRIELAKAITTAMWN